MQHLLDTTDGTVVALLALAVLLVVVVLGRRIDAQIGRVHFELRPNGGSSLRDAVDRIEKRVAKLEERADGEA